MLTGTIRKNQALLSASVRPSVSHTSCAGKKVEAGSPGRQKKRVLQAQVFQKLLSVVLRLGTQNGL